MTCSRWNPGECWRQGAHGRSLTLAICFAVMVIPWLEVSSCVGQEPPPPITANQTADSNDTDGSNAVPGEADAAKQMRNRLVMVGFGVVAFLALLGVVFSYLRLNHATRGFYSGRLQSLAIVCFIAILAVCYFLWSQLLFQ